MRASAKFLGLMLVCLCSVPAVATEADRRWDFEVLLDGSTIGFHRFELTEENGERQLTSEARFDVRFLFFNAFRYRHTLSETWADGCLQRIEAKTQSNGKKVAVSGAVVEDRFVVDTGTEQSPLGDCVMTFAYWNPDFLQQPRLLNPQSGEYLDVQVEQIGEQPIVVRGEEVPASVYRVTAEKMELTLWYSRDDEWLALESVAKGGRIIRYELT